MQVKPTTGKLPSLLRLAMALWPLLLPPAASAGEDPERTAAQPRTGVFETALPLFSPYADQGEIARRMFHLAVSRQLLAHAQSLGQPLRGQVIDPSAENFHVYVPENYDPARAYGLFVWISAREEVSAPARWNSVFAEHDIIFIAADKSGNEAHDLDRRVPLALHAVANMQHLYHIDDRRIYIAGFSGGGRVASKMAAAYGDLFSGGYFIAGSDPIGGKTVPVPAPAVLENMRERGRYVFLAGRYDDVTTTATRIALASYERLCLFDAMLQSPKMGHGLPDARWLRRGLEFLESREPPDGPAAGQRIGACEASLSQQRQALVSAAEKLLEAGDADGATDALKRLQLDFGRLAEDDFDRLYARLTAQNGASR